MMVRVAPAASIPKVQRLMILLVITAILSALTPRRMLAETLLFQPVLLMKDLFSSRHLAVYPAPLQRLDVVWKRMILEDPPNVQTCLLFLSVSMVPNPALTVTPVVPLAKWL